MREWIRLYQETNKEWRKKRGKEKKILLGFNVNIDKIIKITPENFESCFKGLNESKEEEKEEKEEKEEREERERDRKIIETKEEVLFWLVDTMKKGKAEEYLIKNLAVQEWIEKHFPFEKITIGGQAAIMANVLTAYGWKNVILSIPAEDERFKHLLNEEIKIVQKEKEEFKLTTIKEIEWKEKQNIEHYIFEFSAGEYKLKNSSFYCPRNNRFIVSADNINSKMKIDKEWLEWGKENAKSVSAAIISGFHLLEEEREEEKENNLDKVVEFLKGIKEKNEKIKVHTEIASFADEKILRRVIKQIFPLVDSIGLNEQELIMLLKVIDEELAEKIKKENSITGYFRGIKRIEESYPNLRIHLHFLGYYITLSKKVEKEKAKQRRTALIKAAIGAYERVETVKKRKNGRGIKKSISKNGEKEIVKLQKNIEQNQRKNGRKERRKKKEKQYDELGIVNTEKNTIVMIPTLMAKKTKRLVGLGDTISSIAFVEEIEE